MRFNKTWLGQNFSRMEEEVKFLLIHSNRISFLAVTVTCVFKPQYQHTVYILLSDLNTLLY